MSSILDSGYYADQASKAKKEKCPKSKNKNKSHRWKKFGQWPSNWEECQFCKDTIYWK